MSTIAAGHEQVLMRIAEIRDDYPVFWGKIPKKVKAALEGRKGLHAQARSLRRIEPNLQLDQKRLAAFCACRATILAMSHDRPSWTDLIMNTVAPNVGVAERDQVESAIAELEEIHTETHGRGSGRRSMIEPNPRKAARQRRRRPSKYS